MLQLLQTQDVQICSAPQFSRVCQWPHCFNLTSPLVFLLPFLTPAIHFHNCSQSSCFKCKSDHVTTLLNFLQGLPISLRMKPVPWPTRLCFVCACISLWPQRMSVCHSSPATQACLSLEHIELVSLCLLFSLVRRVSLKTSARLSPNRSGPTQILPAQRGLPWLSVWYKQAAPNVQSTTPLAVQVTTTVYLLSVSTRLQVS